MTAGIVTSGLILLGTGIFWLSGLVDLGREFSTEERLTVAIIGSVVLLALSPPSTIAVIKEVRARGPFTSTILSVTVVMDVVVIVLFWQENGLDPFDIYLLQGLFAVAVVVLEVPTGMVADRLGVAEGTVRRHLARARKQLREVLA